ncbi:MAG: hypothetical protein LH702_28145 [Phormidesmis sp. CAN_BIN44]|nr:hypothetical protein [Phormidesmis sp. CAN_BIN44]
MNPYTNGSSVAQREHEWELQEASHHAQFQTEGEWEAEHEYFSKRMLGDIQKVAKASALIAKQLAPIAARTLIGATPNPLAGNLLNSLLRDGETTAVAMEAQLFGSNELEAEVGNTEVAYEAALAEVLAAEASHSNSESEAEAFLGAAVTGIVKSMGGGKVLRAVMPTLVQANARLVSLLHQKGVEGRRLLRLVPSILRCTIASLKAAHQGGQSVNSNLALYVMATQASRVFGNSQVVIRGIIRNALIQKRTTR